MSLSSGLTQRLGNKWRRFTTDRYGRRDFCLSCEVPYVSFTFDDFPRSACIQGGAILAEQEARGTYFVSFQLLGQPSASGPIASIQDVQTLVREGHELGCHTFDHLDGRRSTAQAFERSIQCNKAAASRHLPGVDLPVFAYPLDGPVLAIKRAVGQHFICCRGGGQTFNAGTVDLNLLKAYFLDARNREDLSAVRVLIEANAAACGWLIFATHDVTAAPSKYGCEPDFFRDVVRLARESGARVLPMAQVCRELQLPAVPTAKQG